MLSKLPLRCNEPDAHNAIAALLVRADHQVLKLARIIADLAGEEKIAPPLIQLI